MQHNFHFIHIFRPFYTPEKGFFLIATENIDQGEVVQYNEEQPVRLASRKYVEKNWGPLKRSWFNAYAWPNTDNVFCIWPEDNNTSQPINHSCDPNTWLDGLNLVARRPIKKGEEVTVDYSTYVSSNVITNQFQCFCKSKNCRKLVNYSDYKEKWFQELYDGHVSDYVRQLIENEKSSKQHIMMNGF